MAWFMLDGRMVHPFQTLVDLDVPQREDRQAIAGGQEGRDGGEAIRFEIDIWLEAPIPRDFIKDSPAGKISCRVHPTE